MALPADELATLLDELRAAVSDRRDPDVVAAWEAEIGRRIEELDSGRVTTVPAKDLHGQLQSRLQSGDAD
ncbi:MAG: addiction module protein [Phycisphaerae bacterium]